MKRIYIIVLSLASFLAASCNYLDVVPDNAPTIDHAFTDRNSAENYLATLYFFQPVFGNLKTDPALAATDEYDILIDGNGAISTWGYDRAIQKGLQNVSNPYYDFWIGKQGGKALYDGIRECDTFLSRIESVPDIPDSVLDEWIGEAKFLKAFYHFYLMRLYGPIPVIRQSLEVSAGVNEVRVPREPVQDVVEYIAELCDQAMDTLPDFIVNPTTDLGHATRPAAAMLKAQAYMWLASPLFNGNPDYADVVNSDGKRLFPEFDNSRWEKAAAACKDAIDICKEAGIKLYHYVDTRYDISVETRRLMDIRGAMTEPWNQEQILSHARWDGLLQKHSNLMLDIAYYLGGYGFTDIFASFKMAELFYTKNGVPINEDKEYRYQERYEVTTVGDDHKYYIPKGSRTAVLNTNREPRFYADLGFDTGVWWGNGRYVDIDKGNSTTQAWVVAAKAGETSGKRSSIRHSVSGYFLKKVLNYQSACSSTGSLTTVEYPWPVMRLGDLYLMYAEALNESKDAPDAEVYQYIDSIRFRAGLEGVVDSWSKHSKFADKPTTKDGMREIIHQERLIELAFEGQRFYDLRRWKEAYKYMNEPMMGWNVSASETEDYYIPVLHYQPVFTNKDYLWPIAEAEMLKNSNLVQNPGWE